MSDIKGRKETGLGPNKYGVMECGECNCRAFQIISIKDNESFVRRGKRRTEYRCLGCGETHNSIASNLYDLGQYGWREIPENGVYLDLTHDDHNINESGWLKWPRLNRVLLAYTSTHARMKQYGRMMDSMMELDVD